MRLRITAAAAVLAIAASPAAAHDGPPPPGSYEHQGQMPAYPGGPYPGENGYPDPRPYPGGYQAQYGGYDPAARDAWLADCRHRLSSRDSGVGGAVIGGVVGGVAGNRIAGRGNRTVGTLAGAAVGAAAGAIIDKAEDRGRNRDECEAYLDDYYARYTQRGPRLPYEYGYAQQGYAAYPSYGGYPAYGYVQPCCMAQPMMMVPMMVPAKPQCTETIEYVYEDVPVRPAPRKRYIPKRTKIVPDKRVKIVPQKLIKTK